MRKRPVFGGLPRYYDIITIYVGVYHFYCWNGESMVQVISRLLWKTLMKVSIQGFWGGI